MRGFRAVKLLSHARASFLNDGEKNGRQRRALRHPKRGKILLISGENAPPSTSPKCKTSYEAYSSS